MLPAVPVVLTSVDEPKYKAAELCCLEQVSQMLSFDTEKDEYAWCAGTVTVLFSVSGVKQRSTGT